MASALCLRGHQYSLHGHHYCLCKGSHDAIVCTSVWRCDWRPCLPPACHPLCRVGTGRPLQPPYLWCTMQNFTRRISKPLASCPAGFFISPIISIATVMYNIYIHTMAAITCYFISSWVAANTLPICESQLLCCAHSAHLCASCLPGCMPVVRQWGCGAPPEIYLP